MAFSPVVVQEANLEQIHLVLKASGAPGELQSLGAQLMDDVIADCRYFCHLSPGCFSPCFVVGILVCFGEEWFPAAFFSLLCCACIHAGHWVSWVPVVGAEMEALGWVTRMICPPWGQICPSWLSMMSAHLLGPSSPCSPPRPSWWGGDASSFSAWKPLCRAPGGRAHLAKVCTHSPPCLFAFGHPKGDVFRHTHGWTW